MKAWGDAIFVGLMLIVYFYAGLYFIGYMDHVMGLIK